MLIQLIAISKALTLNLNNHSAVFYVYSPLLHPKFIFATPFFNSYCRRENVNQTTSQLELKVINLGCSKGECRTQLRFNVKTSLIAISCISIHSWPLQIYQLFLLPVSLTFTGAPVLQPLCSCMD